MKFNLLLKELKSLKLPRDEFAVMSGGALAVRGLRETRDIDIVVTQKLWKRLSSKYLVLETDKGYKIVLSRHVEAVGGRTEKQKEDFKSIETSIKRAEMVDGVRFLSLSDVRNFKKQLGRKKDLKDIKLIEEYLDRNK